MKPPQRAGSFVLPCCDFLCKILHLDGLDGRG
jgi:hypothetical protein